MKRILALLIPLLLLTGCDTLKGPNQSFVAPAVEGRVVDAESGAPLQKAGVQRYLEPPSKQDPLAEKGAQRLMTVPTIRSGPDGRFQIGPQRGGYLLMSHPGVFQITLVVRHDTHQTLTTNIDLIKVKPIKTNGVPTVLVGDLPLAREAQ